eukprot:TRINITY_DN22180_c0_g1_i1.p1 TRINITY_DN22180_c0_g1~~TRINITY_DN22180_c0_g1_i1.p1  ORF type:complete len:975 (-),score=136.52 TRINITY_DN22180_c0_g1_i1:198-3122(-)
MGLGYPSLVNAAHVAQVPAADDNHIPSLLVLGPDAEAPPAGSDDAARLPRDVGPRDPAAAAYALSANAGDALGVLATAHLSRTNLINTTTFQAPGVNLASAVVPRKSVARDGCDPLLMALLGKLAEEAIDASSEDDETLQPWGASPAPLVAEKAVQAESDADTAWLQVVLSDPSSASPDDLALAAAKVEESGPPPLRGVAAPNSTELRKTAASRGHSGAALRLAVEHLQQNESNLARPLLEQVASTKDQEQTADAEMATYYLKRYASQEPDADGAFQHLERAADLGREDAELLVAHKYASSNDSANASEAIRRYRRITTNAPARSNGATSDAGASSAKKRVGELSEVQAFAAYNMGVLLLQENQTSNASAKNTSSSPSSSPSQKPDSSSQSDNGSSKNKSNTSDHSENKSFNNESNASNASRSNGSNSSSINVSNASARNVSDGNNTSDLSGSLDNESSTSSLPSNETLLIAPPEEPGCSADAQRAFEDVALSRHPTIRLCIALERRAWRFGDTTGALLMAALLSDLGHPLGHSDAAFFWDGWVRKRPIHLGPVRESNAGGGSASFWPGSVCNLTGWWTTSSAALGAQNVSRVYVTPVAGGGFEMFNASLAAGFAGLQGLSAPEVVSPKPQQSEFRHLHSFLWHTSYDVLPGGGPVPVALQPPGAVPHLVETHHQRGKLFAEDSCDALRVEAMWVNWTFHRLGSTSSSETGTCKDETCNGDMNNAAEHGASSDELATLGKQEFLHCWARPEWYIATLEANIAAAPPQPPPPPEGSWQSLVALTKSKDCPCRGAYGCRRGDGACVHAALPGGATCPWGSSLCPEVDPAMEPAGKPMFAAQPDVCALYYHRRAATVGDLDSTHVMSHAYSNGLRGVPPDAKEAFFWSQRAMHAGDRRGLFDVAYSLEFGIGVDADPQRAYAIYRDLLGAKDADAPMAAKASSFLALLSASGRYVAGRLLGRKEVSDEAPPWASSGM